MSEQNNMVFYRKYRPQKISELDNEVVRENLTSIFSKKSSIHAFLFTGPKGLGKTSTARIVAKVINCTGRKNKSDIEPCNKCEQCLSITNGNNLDILEIDGASNRGIDEIRDLKEKINLAPFKALKKVYIIDEVHMLTTEAFNALLKTLEEPPNHAVFILCTTESQKVPATIASRCFRINFTRATSEELTRSMQRIVAKEDLKIEKEALLEIASLSDGSFRDAAKILEEVSSFANKKNITKDLVSEKYNILGVSESVTKILDSFYKKDIKLGINLCHELVKQGIDFKFFTEKLIERLHTMLLINEGVEKGESIFSTKEITKLFDILSQSYQDMKYAVIAQAPLELAIIEWGEEGEKTEDENKENLDVVSKIPVQALKSDGFFIQLIDEIKNQNKLFAGVLRSCTSDGIKNNILVITASSKFHKEKIEEVKNMKLLNEIVEKLNGGSAEIKVVLKGVN